MILALESRDQRPVDGWTQLILHRRRRRRRRTDCHQVMSYRQESFSLESSSGPCGRLAARVARHTTNHWRSWRLLSVRMRRPTTSDVVKPKLHHFDLLLYKLYNKSTTSWHSSIHDFPLNRVNNSVIMLRHKSFIFLQWRPNSTSPKLHVFVSYSIRIVQPNRLDLEAIWFSIQI